MNKLAIRREQFPVTRNLVYLNHAAVGPLSERAFRAMQSHAREQRDFGALQWRDWLEEYVQFRAEAAQLLNCSPKEISILKNTSEGLSFVAEGYRWNEGDNVITTSMEFPSNYACWKRLERRGVECREIAAPDGSFTVDEVAALIDERTRIVALSAVAFHNGFAPDLVEIGSLCRDRGVLFCVDAIQALGAIKLDVREANISFLAADAHKWLLGPEGTAIFFAADEAREQLEVLETGWMNVDRKGRFIGCDVDLLSDGRRFEAGTLNTNGVYGTTAALELINEIGIDWIEEEVLRLAQLLGDGLEQIGFVVRTPKPYRSGIVGVSARAHTSEALDRLREQYELGREIPAEIVLHRWLEDQDIICAPREKMLRFAPHYYNSEEDIDEVISALADLF